LKQEGARREHPARTGTGLHYVPRHRHHCFGPHGGPKGAGAAAVLLRLQLEQLDEACSRFRPGSELSLAHRSGGKPVVVSGLLAELVQASLDVARLTEGAVDPTVRNAVIGLGYDRDSMRFPPEVLALATPLPSPPRDGSALSWTWPTGS
jgi:ApbE family protein